MTWRKKPMTLEEAQAEAHRRWPADGGWARSDLNAYSPWRRCLVGVLLPLPAGVTKRILGQGHTFERAFAMAQRKLDRDAEKRRGVKKPKKPHPRAFPTVDLFKAAVKPPGSTIEKTGPSSRRSD